METFEEIFKRTKLTDNSVEKALASGKKLLEESKALRKEKYLRFLKEESNNNGISVEELAEMFHVFKQERTQPEKRNQEKDPEKIDQILKEAPEFGEPL